MLESLQLGWPWVALGAVVGAVFALGGFLASRRVRFRAARERARLLDAARREADEHRKTLLAAAEAEVSALEEESDRRESELERRELELDEASRRLEQAQERVGEERARIDVRSGEIDTIRERIREAEKVAEAKRAESLAALERIAGMSLEEARRALADRVAEEARRDAARLSRKILDEARESAAREGMRLVVQSLERMPIKEAVESTVSFVRLTGDELKGRIIGREGRNIRALEMATGIDVIVDDTPGAILISSFDPVRREIARVAIDRLIEDGRIHPARIEEVVAKVQEEFETIVEEEGNQAAFALGISELHPKLARLVGRLKFRSLHGHNLLQHSMEVALLAGFMCEEVGGEAAVGHHAGLLHEIGRADPSTTGHTLLASAELASKYGEPEKVVSAIQSLHPDVDAVSLEAILLGIASRVSDNRPGARKDNLQIFVERLTRLERLAGEFDGVERAFAIKAGKEIRVVVDAAVVPDAEVHGLSKRIARRIEAELAFPGQIKVNVVRETRAVQYAI